MLKEIVQEGIVESSHEKRETPEEEELLSDSRKPQGTDSPEQWFKNDAAASVALLLG